MPDVRIVVPPVLSVTRPSLGVGLLKRELTNNDLSCDVRYVNLDFAKSIGCELNELLAEKIDTRPLLAEWLFSWSLYPDRCRENDGKYIEYAKKYINIEIINEVVANSEKIDDFISLSAKKLIEDMPRIVGISTSFQQNTAALSLAKKIKCYSKDVIICFGGANCEGVMGRAIVRNFSFVDYVFSGESDLAFPAFAKKILGRSAIVRKKVLFIGQKFGDQVPTEDERFVNAGPVTDMESLPTPDYKEYFEGLNETGIASEVRPALVFESSRGCWWGAKHHCKFCGLNGTSMAYRSKSPARVRAELEELSRQWNVQSFMAADNILNHKTIDEIFGAGRLNGGAKINKYSLFYEIKANLNYESLKVLAEGGVKWVQPGIESLDDEILEIMDKGITALQNIRLLRNCSELGIVPVWNLLRGFPGENDGHFRAMNNLSPLLEHLSPPRGPFRIRLDRFSPYFERAGDFGFIDVEPMPGYAAIYSLPASEIRDLAYFHENSVENEDSEALKAWCQSVADWRARHFSSGGAPTLALIEIAGVGIIRDSRSSSKMLTLVVNAIELKLIREFRDPKVVDSVIARLSVEGVAERSTCFACFQNLVDHGIILIDKGKALSIVLDYAFSRDTGADTLSHPFGQWVSSVRGDTRYDAARTFNRGRP